MSITDFVGRFDLDLSLRDAATDVEVTATRRMIASAAIGVDVDDAYYSVREIREAATWLFEGDLKGKAKLAALLSNGDVDDFQRTIYFCLAGRGVIGMLDDLMWLEALLEARGRIAGECRRRRRATMPLVNPYVAAEPDGPLVSGRADFKEGRSWSADPSLLE